jgi:hypothetical protein
MLAKEWSSKRARREVIETRGVSRRLGHAYLCDNLSFSSLLAYTLDLYELLYGAT